MNEGLVAELCSLVEDYKRRDAALVGELAAVNAQTAALRKDCDELLTALRYTDVYVNEVEEAVANLDRELARVQAAYTAADDELQSLRRQLRETHPQQVNRLESELWSLRQETKRLRVVVGEKETELNEYEAIFEKQQSDIFQLTLLVTEFETGRTPPSGAEAMPNAPPSPLLQAALFRRRDVAAAVSAEPRVRTRNEKDDSAGDKWADGKKNQDFVLLGLEKEISRKDFLETQTRSKTPRSLARSRKICSVGGAKAYLERTLGEDVQIRQATPPYEDELDLAGWVGLESGPHVGARWRRRGTGSSGSSIVVPCDHDDSASS